MHISEMLLGNQTIKKSYHRAFREIARRQSLTQNEIDILLFLANNPQFDTAKSIVEIRALSKSQVSASVEKLIGKNYLAANQDRRDRRCVHLKLLPPALPIVQELQGIQKKYLDRLLAGVEEGEKEIFLRVVQTIMGNAERSMKDGV